MNKRVFWIVLAALVFVALQIFPLGLSPQAQTMVAIAALALILWLTEAIPLHATAIVVALAMILVGGFGIDKVFSQFFDRVVVLVLGGYVLGIALSKHELDAFFANKVLKKIGSTANAMLLGMIAVTAVLSMWMANSAAAAICMPIALLILHKNNCNPLSSNFGKAMILGVAYGATIGGMGTIIGSTPNVLAQKFLNESGVAFGFVEWLVRGLPFMVVMVLAGFLVLKWLFKPEIKQIELHESQNGFSKNQWLVSLVFLATVGLWVTESVHGIHNSVVALIPIVLLYLFNLMDTRDFEKVGWDSLILIGGGIALGYGLEASGLAGALSNSLQALLAGQSLVVLVFLVAIVGILLTGFLSNTAASAVLVPIVTALAVVLGVDQTNLVVAGALGVSMDFMFPMGTPPSALAVSTGFVGPRDLFKAGVVLSIVGALLLSVLASVFW